jgi:hypothetical protein
VADEDVIAEADQAPVEDPQVEEAAPVEAQAVESEDAPGDEVVDEQAVVAEAPAETSEPVPEPPDLSQLTATELADLNPGLAEALRNAGAQQREAQLRQEQGDAEATAARVKWLREKSGITEDAATDEDLNFLDRNNLANARQRDLAEFTKVWNSSYEPTADERAILDAAATAGNVGQYALTSLAIAVRSKGLAEAFEMDAADIPPDSKLGKSIRDREASRVVAETKAAELEARETNGALPPTSPTGPVEATAGETDPLLIKLETQGRNALTADEQNRARQLLGLRPA